MSAPLRFDGRVVLVTGAGGGLGKQYALLFAQRGASVVVNDLGGGIKGGGQSSRPADLVVQEIRANGGKAVANYNSVEDGEKLVQTALDNFGRIDIVVNNAGILRDKSFARISDEDWDIIQRVHLRGSFLVTRAAWPHMKKQNYGRIIMTTSAAGIYGNFGQANYSAAKLGLLGLSNTLAIEGAKNNIKCNTIAPMAGSRLTATVMPEDLINAIKPEFVAPLVVYLCHEDTPDSGCLFEAGGGWISQVRWERSLGAILRSTGQPMTPEQVRENWDKITDFNNALHPKTIAENTSTVMKALESTVDQDQPITAADSGEPGKINPELAKATKVAPDEFSYTFRDVILYNLGIGVSTSQEDHLKFLFEFSDGFCLFPTFGFIPAQMSLKPVFTGQWPGLPIDMTKILHGEQYLEVFNPIPTSGTLTSQVMVADVLDKGSGCVIIVDVETFDDAGNKVFFNQFTIFVVGAGKFGGKRSSDRAIMPVKAPARKPDVTVTEKTSIDQAAVYRLSGDYNPLHIDPSFAAMGGFSQPILHGLCSLGYSARHVLKQFADNDTSKFKAIKTRMSKPVLPGQTLATDMWLEGSRVFFETRVVENGNVSLSGGYVDLVRDAGESKTSATQGAAPLASDAVFKGMEEKLSTDLVKKVGAVYLWIVTKDGEEAARWTVDLKNSSGAIYRGDPKQGKAGCQLTLSDEDLIAMVTGKLNPQQAFMKGKLKVKGNIMLSQKLSVLFQQQAKL